MDSVEQTQKTAESQPRALALNVVLPWAAVLEVSAYVALAGLAVGLRFWELGQRAIHYDENVHALWSWFFYDSNRFEHNPLMHGPIQFDTYFTTYNITHASLLYGFFIPLLIGLMVLSLAVLYHRRFGWWIAFFALPFFAFGLARVVASNQSGDAIVRFLPACLGIVLVGLPLLLRQQLGRWGALAASAMIAISPSLVHLSRFAREDMFMLVWTFGMFIASWKYLESRKFGYLIAVALLMALAFLTKETVYLTLPIFASFYLLVWAADWWKERQARKTALALTTPVAPTEPVPSPLVEEGQGGVTTSSPGATSTIASSPSPLAGEGQDGGAPSPSSTPYPSAATAEAEGHSTSPSPLAREGGGEGLAAVAPPPPAQPVLHPALDLFITMLALSLPMWGAMSGLLQGPLERFNIILVNPQAKEALGPVGTPIGQSSIVLAAVLVGFLLFVSTVVGLAWSWRRWLVIFFVFWLPLVFLFATGFAGAGGGDPHLSGRVAQNFASGVWRSLGYWIAQHEVQRANQPWYFYNLLLMVYEFLPLFLGLAASIYYISKRGARAWGVGAGIMAVASLLSALIFYVSGDNYAALPAFAAGFAFTFYGLLKGDRFTWALLYWFWMSLLLFSWSGEKMPWMVVHMALPLILLSGKFVPDMVKGWKVELTFRGIRVVGDFRKAIIFLGIGGALTLGTFLLAEPGGTYFVFWGAFLVGGFYMLRWLLAQSEVVTPAPSQPEPPIITTASLRKTWPAYAGATFSVVLVLFTFQATSHLNYNMQQQPVELMYYAQHSQSLAQVRDRIYDYADQTGQNKNLPLLIDTDGGAQWPFWWYFREYKNRSITSLANVSAPITQPVIVAFTTNKATVEQHIDRSLYDTQDFRILWWFPPGRLKKPNGQSYDAADVLKGMFTSGDGWRSALSYWFRHDLPDINEPMDATVYIRKPGV